MDKYCLDYGCRDEFINSMDRLKKEKVDIFLGNHMQHNRTKEKYEQICSGNKKAFVNPGEWAEYAEWAKQNLLNLMEKEKE